VIGRPGRRRPAPARLAVLQFVVSFALAGGFFGSPAIAAEVTIIGGLSHASGDFGTAQTTRVTASSFSILTELKGWALEASLPALAVEAAGPVDLGGVVVPGGDQNTIRGLGDASVKVGRTYSFDLLPVEAAAGVTAKIPTGSSRLSTGKSDLGFDIELSLSTNTISPFVSVSYRAYGDTLDLPLDDGWTAALGATAVAGRTIFIASYERSQSALGGPEPEEVFFAISRSLDDYWGWTAFGSKGLSDGSVDYIAGVALRRTISW